MARVVVTRMIPDAGLEALRKNHDVFAWAEDGSIPRERLLEVVKGAAAIVSLLNDRIDEELLDAAGPQLRVVANVAVGFNNIDVAACASRGIVATNTPGVLTEATADVAMALILMTTRQLGQGERLIRSGESWQWGMFHMLGHGIQGRQLGIIGLGQIGIALARRAKAFGMTVAYSNRRPVEPAVAAELDATRMDLRTLLTSSDVVSLHCPYSSATHHLIGTEQLEAMRSTAYLINTARGPIVDESALVHALQNDIIAGAGLDVFEREPLVHPGLLRRHNAVLIPHLGSATIETRTAMATLAAANVNAVLNGETPPTPINPVA
jgi:glyoxylate reductase